MVESLEAISAYVLNMIEERRNECGTGAPQRLAKL